MLQSRARFEHTRWEGPPTPIEPKEDEGGGTENGTIPFDEADERSRKLTQQMLENYSRVLHRAREIAAVMKRKRDAENEEKQQRFLQEQRDEKEAAKERFMDKLEDGFGAGETDEAKRKRETKEEAACLQEDINTAAIISALKESGKFIDLSTFIFGS